MRCQCCLSISFTNIDPTHPLFDTHCPICTECASKGFEFIAKGLVRSLSFQKQIMYSAAVEINEHFSCHDKDTDLNKDLDLLIAYLNSSKTPLAPPYPQYSNDILAILSRFSK